MRRAGIALVALVGLTLASAQLAVAQQNDALASPRGTVETFLGVMYDAERGDDDAMAEAVGCLDLTGISSLRDEIGRKRVMQLKLIFDHINLIGADRSAISDAPDGGVPAGEPYVLHQDPDGEGQIELVRLGGEWRFSDYTIQVAIPDLEVAIQKRREGERLRVEAEKAEQAKVKAFADYERTSEWIEATVPEPMRRKALVLKYWQWAGLGALVVAGALTNKLMVLLLLALVLAFVRAQEMEVDKELTRKSVRPFGMLAMAVFWWYGLNWLGLPPKALAVILIVVKFVTAVAGVWGAYRLVDVVSNVLETRAKKSVSKFDDLLVPLVRKSSKVFIVVFGLVFVADSMGISISGMLTGLGLGGLAFALAAQDTVKNFFGSLTVVLDRPFEVGDWVLIDDVEGSVEEVGFRSTRVRTFYQSMISLPNSKLLTAVVDNMGARRFRRWKTTIGVTYDTPPDTLEAFCEGLRELVRRHPNTRKDYFQIYVVGFADSAIEIMLYIFFDAPDWTRELQAKQSLILDIMRLAESLGVEFAFPTQTLHVAGGALPVPTAPHAPAPAKRYASSRTGTARHVGRSAATALLSKARLEEALTEESDRLAAHPSDLAIPEAGATGSAAAERALRSVAGKNWPTSGELSESDDGGAGGAGEG